MKYSLTLFCLSLGLIYSFPGISSAGMYDDCIGSEPKQIISGCTTLIKVEKLSNKDLAVVYARRASVFIEQKKFDLAIADLSELMELFPGDSESKSRLALAYGMRGEDYIGRKVWDQAIVDFETANKLQPNETSLKKRLIVLYEIVGGEHLQKKEYKKAIAAYSKAIVIEDSKAELYASRAEAYVRAHDSGESYSSYADMAIKDFSKAIQLNSDSLSAYKRRGDIYLSNKGYIEAIDDYSEVLRRFPNNLDALLLRAFAYEMNKKTSEAIAGYKAALKADRKNKEAQKGLRRLQENALHITKLIQIELKIARCYLGGVDGKWGPGSRAAMQRFGRMASMARTFKLPSKEGLVFIRNTDGIKCAVPKSKRKNKHKRGSKRKTSKCFTFNGNKFCE